MADPVNKTPHGGSVIVVLGPGGVGKTTIAAALGVANARAGVETGVITVDPTRRLRDAIGVARLAARPHRIDSRRLRGAGLDSKLPFSVMALEVKATWDGLVNRFVADAKTRKRVMDNGFYKNLTGRFAGAESYAALEQVFELHESGRFELAIVDTPPAVHAFDFIEAPDHLLRLLDSRASRWIALSVNAANDTAARFAGRGVRTLLENLRQAAGVEPLAAIAEFFAATAGASEAICGRMRAAAAWLRSSMVGFVLVTSAAEDRLDEARQIVSRLESEGLRLHLVVINRLTDEASFAALQDAPDAISKPLEAAAEVRAQLASGQDGDRLAGMLDFLREYLDEQRAALMRAARFTRRLPARIPVAIVPEVAAGPEDLAGILRISRYFAPLRNGRADRDAGRALLERIARITEAPPPAFRPAKDSRSRRSAQRLG